MIIEEARSSDHPAHKYITWNAREALDKVQLIEAAYLFRSIRVLYTEYTDHTQTRIVRQATVRLTSAVPVARANGTLDCSFKDKVQMLSDEDSRQALIRDLYIRLMSLRDELANLIEFAGVVREINALNIDLTPVELRGQRPRSVHRRRR